MNCGHDPADVYVDPQGSSRCRTCRRQANERYAERHRRTVHEPAAGVRAYRVDGLLTLRSFLDVLRDHRGDISRQVAETQCHPEVIRVIRNDLRARGLAA